jgi:hypothetical protein
LTRQPGERRRCDLARALSLFVATVLVLCSLAAFAERDGAARTVSSGHSAEVVVTPDQNLQAQLDNYPSGTTFRLHAGVYRLVAPLVPKSGQTLIGEGRVVLSGARLLTQSAREGNGWSFARQAQTGPVIGEGAVCLPDAPRCARPEDLFLDDVALRHVSVLAELRPGTWYFDYAHQRIYIGDDPKGRVVEASVTPFAIGGHADRVTLRGLIVEKFATPTHHAAVNGLGRGWTIEQSEVRFNHFAGIRTGDGATARGNHVHHNGAFGLIGSGKDLVIEDNEIGYNNTVGYDPHWGAGGTKWVHTTRLLVRRNYSHHNGGPGLWTDTDNIDVVFEANRVEDNDLGGVFHEVGYRAVIRNNEVSRNGRAKPFPYWVDGAGILIVSSSDVEVYANTVIENWQGIAALEGERGEGGHGPWVLARLYVHDNTVWQTAPAEPGSGRSGVAHVHGGVTAFTTAGNRFVRNTYHLGALKRPFFWMNRDLTEDEWMRYNQDVDGAFLR